MDEILDKLNEEQIKPVLDTEGAVLVLAGAGSGKTRVLTSRIAYIIREGKAELSQILAITFTNKAAGEMKERLSHVIGEGEGKWICTIHSMCVKILREFAAEAGFKPNFSIYSETERSNVIKKCLQELDYDVELLKKAKYHIGNAKMLGQDPDTYAKQNDERDMDRIVIAYERYNRHLKENNALDFDDLLLETLRLLRRNKEVKDYLSDKFKYILVDEFQDTNAVQFNIIKLLSEKHGNIFAVGDDDQSIYGWRGAQIDNILRFDKEFTGAKVYKLERNYRSTGNILALANSIIQNNVRRKGKTLWTEEGEGDKCVYYQAEEEALEALYAAKIISDGVLHGAKYSDYAVLMRINALTRSYEQEFTKYGIPYKVFGGFKFFDRKEIKDVLAYLRLISNPYDSEAVERIINVPRRGIGGKTLEAMRNYAEETGLTLYDACVDCDTLPVNGGVKDKLKDFAALIKDFIIESQTESVSQLVRDVLIATELKREYDDGTDEGDGKLANLDEFIASVDEFTKLNPAANLTDYMNQVTLTTDLDAMDEGDYVTIATIHAVKGLEFPTVIICGLEDGIMPSSRSEADGRSMEEERRLMYVAITRAEKNLYLTRSKSRYLYGRREFSRPSKFILELSKELGIPAVPQRIYGNYYEKYGDYGATPNQTYKENSGFSFTSKPSFKPSVSAFIKKKADGDKNFTVGQKVLHPKFGEGMVIAIKNSGTVLNVAFAGQGIKELSASLAPLQKI